MTWLRPQNLGTVGGGERGGLATFVCDLLTVRDRAGCAQVLWSLLPLTR